MTSIFKKENVSLESEEIKYTFMIITGKTLGELHITILNMPTPPTLGISGSVKRHAGQKIQKTRKKRKVEKVRNLSSIQEEEGDESSENMDNDESHSPPSMELFQQVAELARKIVQNVADEEQLRRKILLFKKEMCKMKL